MPQSLTCSVADEYFLSGTKVWLGMEGKWTVSRHRSHFRDSCRRKLQPPEELSLALGFQTSQISSVAPHLAPSPYFPLCTGDNIELLLILFLTTWLSDGLLVKGKHHTQNDYVVPCCQSPPGLGSLCYLSLSERFFFTSEECSICFGFQDQEQKTDT